MVFRMSTYINRDVQLDYCVLIVVCRLCRGPILIKTLIITVYSLCFSGSLLVNFYKFKLCLKAHKMHQNVSILGLKFLNS